ncbi:MAG: DUF5690 family protein [Myxococcota bacterium]
MQAILRRAPPPIFAAYAIFAAFGTYFCMYAFRKPFAVARFEGQLELPGLGSVDYKIVLIVLQLLGYASSKFVGIKVVSELPAERRPLAIVLAIAFAQLALVGFWLAPKPWAALFLLANGLPLGMVWGLVFGFLEGRRQTELLGAGLSASYIVASGFVKSVGKAVLDAGISEAAMPMTVGFVFFPLLLGFVALLRVLPPPTPEDEASRIRRRPMNGAERRSFFIAFMPGLLLLTFLYFFLTAYRDFRDNFARELWNGLGLGEEPAIYALSELPIAFGVLLILAVFSWVKDNRRALLGIHVIMGLGGLLIGLLTFGFQAGLVSPTVWMIGVGFGLYVAYVPFGCVLFDRLIAAMGTVATAGFMIYVTDAVGYLGSITLYGVKTFGSPELSWVSFFAGFSYLTSAVCTTCFVGALIYFERRAHEASETQPR